MRCLLTTAAVALALAGCGAATHRVVVPPKPPTPIAALAACLKHHGSVTVGDSTGLEYNAVGVTVYPTAKLAKASITPPPTLEFQLQDGRYLITHGDALRGTEDQDTLDVQACIRMNSN